VLQKTAVQIKQAAVQRARDSARLIRLGECLKLLGDGATMASAVARAYNGDLGRSPQQGSRGKALMGGQGANPAPHEAYEVLCLKQ